MVVFSNERCEVITILYMHWPNNLGRFFLTVTRYYHLILTN